MHLSTTVLKHYRRRLTNLSSRNRSLLLSSLPVGQFVDFHEADFRLNKSSFELLAGLMARKAFVALCPVADPRDERSNTLSKHLRRLARTDRFIEEERGTTDLYVGWPFVRGRFLDGTPVHGPLLFFPVGLTTEGNEWRLVRRGDAGVQLNQSMALAYSHFSGIKLADEWVDPDFGDFDKDPLTFRTQLYDWLKSSPLEINFNTRNFTNLLQPFDKQTAKALLTTEKVGELLLMPEAVLGIFPQAGSFLVPDYDTLIDNPPPTEAAPDPASLLPESSQKEASLLLPLPVDAPQEAAIRAVKAGQSVVVQGPPGTGKSQMIANLMADAAAQGKRVLLVCQKRAALDVVYQRLAGLGMAPFAALVHDFQDDRKPLYAQLTAQIDALDTYRQENNGLDAVLLDRQFAQESRRIDALVAELQTVKDALFDTSLAGVSVKELYLSSHPNVPGPNVSDLFRQFRLDTLGPFRDRLANYLAFRQHTGPNHPFAHRVSFAAFGNQEVAALRETIRAVAHHVPDGLNRATALLGEPTGWADLTDRYLPRRANLEPLPQTVADPLVWAVLGRVAAGSVPEAVGAALATDQADLDALAARGLLQTDDLTGLPARLNAGLTARQSTFKWLFYSDKAFLTDLARAHGLGTSVADLYRLETYLVNRQSWEARANETGQQFAGLAVVGASLAQTNAALATLTGAVQGAEHTWQTLKTGFPPLLSQLATAPSGGMFGQHLTELIFLLNDLATRQRDWVAYLTVSQIATLANDPAAQATAFLTALNTDLDNLMEMDRIRAGFTTPETQLADRVTSLAELDNALRLAWIDAIEQQHPALRAVSSLKMGQDEAALQTSIRQKQPLTRAILGLKLREQTYQSLVVNRLNNVVSYRELRHQTTKKRSIWPIRKLMEHYAADVFRLVPCWMASPEAVSALFPMQPGLFDLVIFDEASQCFAENGLPAMFRGKQVVVTGDSQQLRPSDLYRARFDTDVPDDDTEPDTAVALEVESLLELAGQFLPQVSLTGHYRSRSLDLIAFSNQHFYANTLSLLPDFADINDPEPGIRYQNAGGQWVNNTNPIEAAAVLVLVAQLQTQLPGRSVGVVTFNFQQQQLIQELLEETPLPVAFVKNIENVQGDECDVLIFSVGYAPDANGRVAAQFGSLSMPGGENRLNVAITRARERIYLITSLEPHQLSVENATNNGPKLLKAYLAYAQQVAQGRFRAVPQPVAGVRAGGLLKQALAMQNPAWQPELPFADLTIRENDTYLGLILTDDDQYFHQTPKEAHAYRPFALASRQWPFQRAWSREFWRAGGVTTAPAETPPGR